MKTIRIDFQESDIPAIVAALDAYSSFDFELSETQEAINNACLISAGNKVVNEDFVHLTENELRMIAAALRTADLVIRGKFDADDEVKEDCMKNIFSINRLLKIFNSQFDM